MSSNLNFINPIYKELLHILKGNSLLSGLALTAIYPLSSSVNPHSVRVGMVGHLAVEAGVTVSKLGLPDDENVMPVFYQNAGDNRAVPGGAFQHVPTFPANITEYDSPLNPNPTGNTLNIEIDAEAYALAQASAVAVTDAKSIKQAVTFDVRLYDGQGIMQRRTTSKGEKVEFSVANLPNGIYFLHVYDGVNEKPEVQKIIVEH
jgi:hypothetical protein